MPNERLTHRQRILCALEHQQPDRVPLDLGSTVVTGIARGAYNKLKKRLGLELGETRLFDRAAQVAVVDDEILDLFRIDTRGVVPGSPENRPPVELKDEDGFIDEWGMLRKMPPEADSYFVCNAPLAGEITTHDILNYNWPDPADPGRTRGLKEKISALRNLGDWAILLPIPGNFIAMSTFLRGFEDWYVDTALNPELLGVLMDQILEIQMEMCSNILREAGREVDVVVNLDDLATQDRLLVSRPVFQRLLEPRMRKFYEFVRNNTPVKVLHHSCGAVGSLLGSLIEMGVDAVNPVQVSAKGMDDVTGLKSKYGSRLSFWGGIDTQHVLPFGSEREVQNTVEIMINSICINGGYVLSSVHNIQNDVEPANIITMFETALNHPLANISADD